MTTEASKRPVHHRGLFWSAMLAALAVLVSGVSMAVIAYRSTSGPVGTVKGYFSALAHSDAARALGYGDLPPGVHSLLTSTVLREQQRIARISQVNIIASEEHGNTATVTVQYSLGFSDGAQQAVDTVSLVKRGRSWRLTRTAVATDLNLKQALNRATILGGGLPGGKVLLFPGAYPITFDTRYLGLDPATSAIRLSDPPDTDIMVGLTPDGRRAISSAVEAGLTACLSAGAKADPRCPLPSDRYVPGTVSATLSTTALAKLALSVAADPNGRVDIRAANVTLSAQYQRLDFNNVRTTGSGPVKVSVAATAYAVDPIVISWGAGS